jgi:hypothetical protein
VTDGPDSENENGTWQLLEYLCGFSKKTNRLRTQGFQDMPSLLADLGPRKEGDHHLREPKSPGCSWYEQRHEEGSKSLGRENTESQ